MNDINEKYIDIIDKRINGAIHEINAIFRNGEINRNIHKYTIYDPMDPNILRRSRGSSRLVQATSGPGLAEFTS